MPNAQPINMRHDIESDTALQMFPHTELDKLRDGTADEYTVNTLAFRLNWGYVMAGMHFDNPEVCVTMEAALAAISNVKSRYAKLGKLGTTAIEFVQLGDGLNRTDEMQKATTRREHRDALEVVFEVNKLKQKNAL